MDGFSGWVGGWVVWCLGNGGAQRTRVAHPQAAPNPNPTLRYTLYREPFCLISEALQLAALLVGSAFCEQPLPSAAAGVVKLVLLSSCGSLFYIQVGLGLRWVRWVIIGSGSSGQVTS